MTGSNTYAAAWHVVKKLHISEFKSKFGVMITIDSAYGNDKIPNVCSKKVLCNYFGETVSGEGGATKMFHEQCADGTTSVGIPHMSIKPVTFNSLLDYVILPPVYITEW